MTIKIIEIRDANTFIPAMAIKIYALNPAQWYLIRRAGYSGNRDHHGNIILMKLVDSIATNDIFHWIEINGDSRTMPAAHTWIEKHFDEIKDGDVIDVQFILGETSSPKVSERAEGMG